jgi:hypothetical protein
MSQLFSDAVIATLRDRRIREVNFSYGPTKVYPSGYYGDVARAIRHGHIQFVVTSGDASYTADAPRGATHTWSVPNHMAETDRRGNVRVKGALSAGDRGTIVHEATHALQDYQRLSEKLGSQFTPQMAEGSAYVAAWIARLQWGYPRLAPNVVPSTSHAYARSIAGKLLDGEIVYIIPNGDVQRLNALVRTGSAHRYVFNGL